MDTIVKVLNEKSDGDAKTIVEALKQIDPNAEGETVAEVLKNMELGGGGGGGSQTITIIDNLTFTSREMGGYGADLHELWALNGLCCVDIIYDGVTYEKVLGAYRFGDNSLENYPFEILPRDGIIYCDDNAPTEHTITVKVTKTVGKITITNSANSSDIYVPFEGYASRSGRVLNAYVGIGETKEIEIEFHCGYAVLENDLYGAIINFTAIENCYVTENISKLVITSTNAKAEAYLFYD